MTMCRIKEAI